MALAHALFARIEADLERVLDDIEPRWLDTAIEPGANSIGWLAWHLTRSHDRNMSEIRGDEQVWISGGWFERFDRPPDVGDTGFGHAPDDVDAFVSPPVDVLVGYHHAVTGPIYAYLADAGDDDLDRSVTSPTLGNTRTVAERIAGVLIEGLEHVGQMAFTRGVLDRRRAD
jgi:hypothetical protein